MSIGWCVGTESCLYSYEFAGWLLRIDSIIAVCCLRFIVLSTNQLINIYHLNSSRLKNHKLGWNCYSARKKKEKSEKRTLKPRVGS